LMASALNSSVYFFFAMTSSYRTRVRFGVSTRPDHVHPTVVADKLGHVVYVSTADNNSGCANGTSGVVAVLSLSANVS
jgi:hypothetical protein